MSAFVLSRAAAAAAAAAAAGAAADAAAALHACSAGCDSERVTEQKRRVLVDCIAH